MHFRISKSYFNTWSGSRSAYICIFLCTSRFSKLIISKVLVLEVHRFDHFYALPDFQNLFPEVHRFGNFYALPDFQNLFYHKKWFQKCIDLIIFMHFQISKSYFITWNGSRNAYICIFLCTSRFSKLLISKVLVLEVHRFDHFYALPDFQNLFPEVHRFGNFYALPDFQNLFYHKKWFQKCIDLILFMHFQISKSYFITWSGSRSACICIF